MIAVARKSDSLSLAKERLTQVVVEVFADRPSIDLSLALGAGHRALERGTPFFEAVEIAEGVLAVWRASVERVHDYATTQRNRERLTEYQIKRFVTKGE